MSASKSQNNTKKEPVELNFYAVDKKLVSNDYNNRESVRLNNQRVSWGSDNLYPNHIYDLYSNVTTLKTVVDGITRFISGQGTEVEYNIGNIDFNSLIKQIAFEYTLYNGFALNIIRNRAGDICDIKSISLSRLRTNEDRSIFWYNKDYNKAWLSNKTIEIPAFDPVEKQASSIYFYTSENLSVYPVPVIESARKACELEIEAANFHLNGIRNGFNASAIVSFMNGIPDSKNKEEIEKFVNEKFSGSENAGRILVNFCNDKDHSVEIQTLNTQDFSDKYNSALNYSRQQIFSAYSCNPKLLGLFDSGGAFFSSADEIKYSYKLLDYSVIKPAQNIITDCLRDILSCDVVINRNELFE